MAQGQWVAYYRVSTTRQSGSGLGLDAQKAAVRSLLNGAGALLAEFTENESGKRADRPEMVRAWQHAGRVAPGWSSPGWAD